MSKSRRDNIILHKNKPLDSTEVKSQQIIIQIRLYTWNKNSHHLFDYEMMDEVKN